MMSKKEKLLEKAEMKCLKISLCSFARANKSHHEIVARFSNFIISTIVHIATRRVQYSASFDDVDFVTIYADEIGTRISSSSMLIIFSVSEPLVLFVA